MRRKLTATLISKLTVPDGKKSIKIFDTEVAGLGVRKMATGIASFIFEKRPKGAYVLGVRFLFLMQQAVLVTSGLRVQKCQLQGRSYKSCTL
jgi:hypothetical protein